MNIDAGRSHSRWSRKSSTTLKPQTNRHVMIEASQQRTDDSVSEDTDPNLEDPETGEDCIDLSYHHSSVEHSDTESEPVNSASTKSLSEHVIQEVFENGRRYCNDSYYMPNDQPEQTRLSVVHQIYLLILDGQLTKAPLPHDITRVLDVGAGPGDWALAMGEQYPDTEIIANDIGIFDDDPSAIAPPNVSFQIDDAESEWTYHEPFDFIHFRGLSGAFADWALVYRQAFNHLKPGGYIEVSDFDLAAGVLRMPNVPANSYLSIFLGAVRSAADETGYPRGHEHLRSSTLAVAGFVDIRTFDIEVPVGTWPQDARKNTLGKMALITLLESLESTSMRPLTRQIGWDVEEVRDLCDKVKMEIVAEARATVVIQVVVSQKPKE